LSKSHNLEVIVPVDWSVNNTASGAGPEVGVAPNAATGADGGLFTVMYPAFVSLSAPTALVAVSRISKIPEEENEKEGFLVVANWVQTIVAFLYSHFQDVGELVDWSVNVTVSGAVPKVGAALNAASGGNDAALTVM
jgi:hypothetical protein